MSEQSDTPIYARLVSEFRWRGVEMCTVCGKYPLSDPGSPGLGGALCLVCVYDL
jgi:hypothetical protein